MTTVIDRHGNAIHLKDCACGAEPEYWSANGLAHEIICRSCGVQTDVEMCGMDAVHSWQEGVTFASGDEAPLRRMMNKRAKATP